MHKQMKTALVIALLASTISPVWAEEAMQPGTNHPVMEQFKPEIEALKGEHEKIHAEEQALQKRREELRVRRDALEQKIQTARGEAKTQRQAKRDAQKQEMQTKREQFHANHPAPNGTTATTPAAPTATK